MSAERRAAIEAAIAELPPLPNADILFFVRNIERALDDYPQAVEVRPPLPRESAAALRQFAEALRDTTRAADAIRRNTLATEALETARRARGLEWKTPNPFLLKALRALIDDAFPHIAATADDAATALDNEVAAKRPRGRNDYLVTFARILAACYQHLTGKAPAVSRGESPFVRFVSAIFDIVSLSGASHYSRLGALAHRNDTSEGMAYSMRQIGSETTEK